jgi:hypothetical protein
LRIESPEHLRPLYQESCRRNTRHGVRLFLITGLFMSTLLLGVLSLEVSNGRHVAPYQWFLGAVTGPLCFAVMVGALRLRLWINSMGPHFAELCGDKVLLGPMGHTFRTSRLVYCRIESDSNFPGLNHLCFFFRIQRFLRPQYWTMVVEDLHKAEEFRRAVLESAASA